MGNANFDPAKFTETATPAKEPVKATKVRFMVTLNLDDKGKVDLELLEANLNKVIQHGVDEGAITPDHDDHAGLVDIDILPMGIVEE